MSLNPSEVLAERRARGSSFWGACSCSHAQDLLGLAERRTPAAARAAAQAGSAGPRQQMVWDSSACSRFGRERSTWSPFQSDLRLISNFWLHYLAGLFIFCLSEFSSLPVVVPSS